jgi:propionate catabolism operon transcriptional regulator
MDKYRICCVTYRELDSLVKAAICGLKDDEVETNVISGLREEILPGLQKKIADGIEVIIAGGANAKIARNFCNIPVLDYRISSMDYLLAVQKSCENGRRAAIVTYREPIGAELKHYLDEVHMDVVNIIYEDTQELEERLKEDRADTIIGGAHAVEIAEKLHKKSVLIYPGQSAIRDSILQAKELLKRLRMEKENSLFIQAMVDYSANGILMTDKNGCILNHNFSAVNMLEYSGRSLKGQYIQILLPAGGLEGFARSGIKESKKIIRTDTRELLQTWIRIEDKHGQYIGNVCVLSDVSDIQKMQLEYKEKERKTRQERGFEGKYSFSDIIGSSYAIKECITDARFFASSDANVLIYGETGVGKELFAQGIHNNSRRHKGPFIGINCAALPENLLETELFGYDEGAFTGGKKGGKKGLFELAENGTLFLDEVGEISPSLQARLLRVLQEKEVMHVGGDRMIPINARVISATNRNLERLDAQSFRRDLLYRLNVLELKLPPLREREGDVIELFEAFYAKKTDLALHGEVKPIIASYTWPGNIRELQNVCERYYLYIKSGENRSTGYIKRCMVRAIGEERLFQDILARYHYSMEHPEDISAEMVNAISGILMYSKEQIAVKLGTSRTTLWRKLSREER